MPGVHKQLRKILQTTPAKSGMGWIRATVLLVLMIR
jgi:hypothetical protein